MNVLRFVLHSFVLCLLAGSLFYLTKGYGFRFNMSPSLPYTWFFAFPKTTPELNQLISFIHPKSSVYFAKVIVGVPGDLINVSNQKVYINGIEKGAILNGIKPIEAGVIPQGHYFVMGYHPESFDSRYEEFGLVSCDAIKERLCPIF